MSAASTEVRLLRSQIRWWRRGRADTRLGEVLGDAYIAVFSVVLLGALGTSALLEVRAFAGTACTSPGCADARSALPALFALALVSSTLALCRLFGPMLVTPAVAGWLLPAPLDRRSLLRPRLLVTLGSAFALSGLLSVAAAILGGLAAAAVAAFGVLAASCCAATVALTVLAQPRHGHLARWADATVALLLWGGLLALSVGGLPLGDVLTRRSGGWLWAATGSAVAAVTVAVLAERSLPRLGRAHLAAGGTLAPSLSGALAVLDLALVYDVLLARRWRSHSRVVPVRRVPIGLTALVSRDATRLRRSPRPLLLLVATLVLPYLAVTLGLGRVTLLVAATTGFVAGLGLFPALRVLARTPGLVRLFPHRSGALYAAAVAVPGTTLLAWGTATAPALHAGLEISWPVALLLGVTVGAAALAAVTWWMVADPPDYQMPMVSSPAGAVPPALFLAAARGFDVVLLVIVPVLVAPTLLGASVALALAGGVLWWQLGRE